MDMKNRKITFSFYSKLWIVNINGNCQSSKYTFSYCTSDARIVWSSFRRNKQKNKNQL